MMNARLLVTALVAMELAACVSQGSPEAGGAPARLILDPLVTRRNASAGVLSIRRDATSIGEECRHRIFLDGNPVADLRPNEVVTIYARPGQHLLRAEQTGSSCHGGNEIAATSEQGKWRTFTTAAPKSNGALLAATVE
jgi:hypothetical protein